MKIKTLGLIHLLLLPMTGIAANFSVNTVDDLIDLNPGDGVCEASLNANDCSLRAAIMETNALSSSDNISLPAGLFVLNLIGEDDFAQVGDLDVTFGQLTIDGVSTEQTIIDGNGTDRIFEFNGSDITLQNMTLRNGGNPSATVLGGAISVAGDDSNIMNLINIKFENNRANAGGALFAASEIDVTIKNSVFTNNTTVPLGITNTFGPAIFCSSCNIIIDSSTISFNHTGSKAIRIEGGNLEMLNSTVSNNDEGGLRTTNANAIIKFSTFVENGGQNLSHFSFDDTQFLQIGYSVLQISTSDNCQTGDLPISLGYNISSDASCAFSMTGDMENTDAELRELTNNGGSTSTHHPNDTSILIDHVPVAACLDTQGIALLTDQRAQLRPYGPFCDVGAVEVGEIIFVNGFE